VADEPVPADYGVRSIGVVRSRLTDRADAPRQPDEGAPDAAVVLDDDVTPALAGIEVGDRLELLTWLHLADRSTLTTYPRGDTSRPLTGVFATRSPDRPNPIGLHTVTVMAVDGCVVRVDGLEALDGTPVIDIKPALGSTDQR
jgi:tRNA-Thr(GGU) m(6)t(6)A37 methyltransferase TsaA